MASSGDSWQRVERPGSSIKREMEGEREAELRAQTEQAHEAHEAKAQEAPRASRPWWRFWRRDA